MMRRPAAKRGFSLIELLVVLAIVVALIALLMPALNGARKAARNAQCLSNQRQLAMLSVSYAMDNKDLLPPVRGWGWYFYALSPNVPQGYRNIGVYFQTGYARSVRVMFCPEAPNSLRPDTDPAHYGFSIESHSAMLSDPFQPPSFYGAPYDSGDTEYFYRACSYGIRPVSAQWDGTHNYAPTNWYHLGSSTAAPPVSYPQTAPDWEFVNVQNILSTLSSRQAIMTDVWGLAELYQTIGHDGVINRAFGDGSVQGQDYSDTALLVGNPHHGVAYWQTLIDR